METALQRSKRATLGKIGSPGRLPRTLGLVVLAAALAASAVATAADTPRRLSTALDGAWYNGGTSSIDGVEGEKFDNPGFGLTLGYQINENLSLSFGYKSTITIALPGTFEWTGSRCRSCRGGTRSSKERGGCKENRSQSGRAA